jgi:ketosteroid isomerase-like protein|tara:strand:- start:374 stop:709 length:336 start_codon:yes stop_codon:yes gene_type:complete
MDNLKNICLTYFKTFSNQDLDGLRKLLSEDCYLRDWEVNSKGLDNVIKSNEQIFEAVESVEVRPSKMFQEDNTVACEIEVVINETDTLLVTDIITFDSENKINSIRAYKGN